MLVMSEGNYTGWRKSSYSNSSGNCAEVTIAGRLVAIRDTRQGGHGPTLEFTVGAWRKFIGDTKAGERNLPTTDGVHSRSPKRKVYDQSSDMTCRQGS
jgi:hypothetical protein